MRCSKCGSENREGRKFCKNCGTPLVAACPKCGAAVVEPDEKFCGECGTALGDTASAAADVTQTGTAPPVGERRHLTILFCDLVGSVTITSQLDPEEWRATVAGYQRAASEAVTRFGGEVVRYIGDGIMAFFGYPVAHDNDAERAARAGLAILDTIAQLNESQSGKPKLGLRIGIDSGLVVVGTGAGQAVDAFGDAANRAARVQSAAEPDTVVVSDATHRLISGLFVVEDRGAQTLKGIEQPVLLYRVVRPSGVRSRFEAAAATGGLTPFVGREEELRLLLNRWERARESEGQVVTIIGEAGVGKSRLVHRFQETIVGTPHTWLEAGAGVFFQNTPFYPVTEALRQFNSAGSDPIADLVVRLDAAGLKPDEAIPLLALLLNLPLPPEYQPSTLPPDQQRRRLLATLVEWLLGSARTQVLVSVIEDLHWADPSTLEWIQLLVEQGATAPVMLIYTARPEFHPRWPLRAHHTQINLNRLSIHDVRTMVREVAAQKALSEETVGALIQRAGGVPLFVEELTRAVLEIGDGGLKGNAIPVTLHDSLMSRLDRLGSAKEVAQIGSVIGAEFSYELLHTIHPMSEPELQRALRSLTDAELLYARGIAPDATYQFKHALIRDAAYEALLKSRRKELHRLVAQTIDEQFAAMREDHPEVLAQHWTEAGETDLAINEWAKAAKKAEARNAFKEALQNYQEGLALLGELPASPERDARETKLRRSTFLILTITEGWSSPESAAASRHASALAEKSGDLELLAETLGGQTFVAWIAGDLGTALGLANRTHQLRLQLREPFGLADSHMLQVMTRYWLGDLASANEYFESGLPFFENPDFLKSPIGRAVAAYAYGSYTAWTIGRPDTARERADKIRMVTDAGNPHMVAFAGHREAWLWNFMRDYQRSEAIAAKALELSEKHQFSESAARSRCLLGYSRAELGQVAHGIMLMQRGLADLAECSSPLGASYFMATIATAQALDGNFAEALDTIERALRTNPEQLAVQPELNRIRGEVRSRIGAVEAAETDFREAIAFALRISAKSWELRATTSLARLLRDTNRRDEARKQLAQVYNWFTEGLDTLDLREAKALLDELSA